MKKLNWLLILLCIVISGCSTTQIADSKKIEISGGQEIQVKFERGIPVSAKNELATIEVAGLLVGPEGLIYTFVLQAYQPLESVIVEDVTGSEPILLVTDMNPSVTDNYWKGNSTPYAISKSNLPWLYEDSDTLQVFRITLKHSGIENPNIMIQPSLFSARAKLQLRRFANNR